MRNDVLDASDLATETEELLRQAALSRRLPEGPAPCGFCLWCEEPLPAPRRWCDAECRDAWEQRERSA